MVMFATQMFTQSVNKFLSFRACSSAPLSSFCFGAIQDFLVLS